MPKFAASICLLLAFSAFLGSANAQEPIKRETQTERVTAWIESLGAPSFSERRKSFLRLWEAGGEALPALRQAAESGQRQVSESAALLEKLIKLETLPETPEKAAQAVRLLSEVDNSTLMELCKLGFWDIAEELLKQNEKAAAALTGQYGRAVVNQLLTDAARQGDVSKATPFLNYVVEPDQLTWIAKHAGIEIDESKLSDPDIVAWQAFHAGDYEVALNQQILVSEKWRMVSRGGLWDRLTEPQFIQLVTAGRKDAAALAAEAVLYDFAGDAEKSSALWDEALQVDSEENQDKTRDEIALEMLIDLETKDNVQFTQLISALLMSGQVQPVGEFLRASEPDRSLNFLTLNNNFKEAFAAVELKADLSNFDEWLEKRFSLVRDSGKPSNSSFWGNIDQNNLAQTSMVASYLLGLGFQEEGKEIFGRLADLADQNTKLEAQIWLDYILRRTYQPETRRIVLQLAIDRHPSFAKTTRAAVLADLFPEISESVISLRETLPIEVLVLHDELDTEVCRWRALEHLHRYDESFFGENSSQLIEDWLEAAWKRAGSQKSGQEDVATELAKVAEGFNQVDLALKIYNQATLEIYAPITEAVELSLRMGDANRAASYLRIAEDFGVNDYTQFLKERTALLQGDYERADEIRRVRLLRPFSHNPNYYGYSGVVSSLRAAEHHAEALFFAKAAFLFSKVGTYFELQSITQSMIDSLKELDREQDTADLYRSLLVECLQANSEISRVFVLRTGLTSLRYFAQQERVARGLKLIEDGEYAEAARHFEVAIRINPQDIDLVVKGYPKLIAAGQNELAEKLFEQFDDAMRGQLEQWPNDTTALNNLAWMYANCSRNLEEAERLSKRSIELSPSADIYIDTLAEIYYRQGNVEAAIEEMRRCVRMDPREAGYRENLVRFGKGQR